jgi:hypothetical protein
MISLETLGRIFLVAGVLFLIAGGLLLLAARLGLPLGRLPGDIRLQGENVTCLIPLATMIILSLVLTVILNVIVRLFNR